MDCRLLSAAGGQKTGAFLDQRENRVWATGVAYGSTWTVSAIRIVRRHLASVCDEWSHRYVESAVALGRRNADLNELSNVRFETENVFDRLKLYDHLKRRDTIVLVLQPLPRTAHT
jgi:hypothetical protein